MNETISNCGRSDDLIAFIYHELDEQAARNFQGHLRECTRCSAEVLSFGEIRQSIISWRDASLGSLAPIAGDRLEDHDARRAPSNRSSALAAIREFLFLSPAWLKGAAAFTSILFCVCAVLAIAYLRDDRLVVVRAPATKVYSQQQLDAEIAKAVSINIKEVEARQARMTETANAPESVAIVDPKSARSGDRVRTRPANATVARDSRKPLTLQERQELAADLGLSGSFDDEDLYLVTDKITQAP